MKRIAIIGSTGYIGTQALQIVEKYPDKFKVAALTANSNSELLIAQAKKFKSDYAGICNADEYRKVKDSLACEVGCGTECLKDAASVDCDIVLVAVVGCVGLISVLAAIEKGTTIALANKEPLVAAGELVTKLAREKGVELLPVDSEHSAIWQCLRAGHKSDLKRLILTASGGPFYGYDKSKLFSVTPEDAVKHPTWQMGKKISVDSATMMNKGLEIIEARWLFDTLNIDYVIHPQSIIHSMVEFCDGSVIAQMSSPDMRLPIQTAFSYPERLESDVKPLDFCNMTFLSPKEDLFPLPKVAKKCLQTGKTAPCVMNAANEAAVALFLNGKISFLQIGELVQKTLDAATVREYGSAQEIFAVHNETYEKLMMDYN